MRSTSFRPSLHPSVPEPLIIDCGANIGISVLEWKTRWPMARVICFEPDPDAFRLLQMNIEQNGVPGVKCIHAAVADFDGQCNCLVISAKVPTPEETRSKRLGEIVPEHLRSRWRASGFRGSSLSHRVAFLKIDIEGAEEAVLREIGPQLTRSTRCT